MLSSFPGASINCLGSCSLEQQKTSLLLSITSTKVSKKPIQWMFPCIRRKNMEDDDPEKAKETGAAGKGRDGEKVNNSFDSQDSDADPCPAETVPGPSFRVQEVQGRTSDENQEFDLSELNSSPTMETLHRLCKRFSSFDQEEKWHMAKVISTDHLYLMIDHYLESEETACDQLMCAVFSEGSCNDLNTCLSIFIMKLSESEILNGDELPLAKVKAIRGIRTIVADLSNIQTLKDKLLFHFVALANFLFSQFQPKEQGTRRKLKTYLVPGEAIDIFGILLQRLNLVHDMKAYFFPK